MYDFMPNWQSLEDDDRLLLIYNRQRHAVLDLRTRKIYKIEENRLPHGYLTVAFYFPMDTGMELEELGQFCYRLNSVHSLLIIASGLVRVGEEFRTCEYLRTNLGDYDLKEETCKPTP